MHEIVQNFCLMNHVIIPVASNFLGLETTLLSERNTSKRNGKALIGLAQIYFKLLPGKGSYRQTLNIIF